MNSASHFENRAFSEQGTNEKFKAKSCNRFFSSSVNLNYLINNENNKDNNVLLSLFQAHFSKTRTLDSSNFFFVSLSLGGFECLL